LDRFVLDSPRVEHKFLANTRSNQSNTVGIWQFKAKINDLLRHERQPSIPDDSLAVIVQVRLSEFAMLQRWIKLRRLEISHDI